MSGAVIVCDGADSRTIGGRIAEATIVTYAVGLWLPFPSHG